MLGRPIGYWTSVPVNCSNVSGKTTNQRTATWTLNQTGDEISGSLTTSEANCGTVTWQVAGRINGGVATLTATQPSPSGDKCGLTPAAWITAKRKPYCNTTGPDK